MAELDLENKSLETEILSLKAELKDREDYQTQNYKLASENATLLEQNEITKRNIENAKNYFLNKKDAISIDILQGILEGRNPPDMNEKANQKEKSALKKEPEKQTKYYESIKSLCTKETKQLLENPKSRANMLLILEIYNNENLYTNDEIQKNSGIPRELFSTIFNNAAEAGLIGGGNNNKTIVSESGINKINELKNDSNLSDLVNAIDEINSYSEEEILSILRSSSLKVVDIKSTIKFNPNIKKILSKLIEDKRIHKEGSVYFFGT